MYGWTLREPAGKRSKCQANPSPIGSKGSTGIPLQDFMDKGDLCYLYDTVYIGKSSSILHEVSRSRLSNSDIGFLCRYACEYYLRWGPEETIQRLSRAVLRIMKLDNLVEDMAVPPEISPPEKKIYLYFLMYQEYFKKYPKELFVTAIYQSVLKGHRKEVPRCFFSGGYGAEQNARICLMYALQTIGGCHTARDCARLMSSRQTVPFLKKAKLYHVMERRYKSPELYLRDALVMVGMLDLGELIQIPEKIHSGKGVENERYL